MIPSGTYGQRKPHNGATASTPRTTQVKACDGKPRTAQSEEGNKRSTSKLGWVSASCAGVPGGPSRTPRFGAVDPEDLMKPAGHSKAIDLSQPDTLSTPKRRLRKTARSNSVQIQPVYGTNPSSACQIVFFYRGGLDRLRNPFLLKPGEPGLLKMPDACISRQIKNKQRTANHSARKAVLGIHH